MSQIPLNNNGDVPLDSLLRASADFIEIADRTDRFPTNGRVLEDPETGNLYLGDGSQWIRVDQDSGIDTPAVTTERSVTDTLEIDYSERWPHSPRQHNEWEGALTIGADPGMSHPLIDGSRFSADGVADPFFLSRPGDDVIHIFAEALKSTNEIGHWTSTDLRSDLTADSLISGISPTSYPFVFRWDGREHMVPDGISADEVAIATADDDTLNSWTEQHRPIQDPTGTVNDATMIWVPSSWPQGRWWVFYEDGNNDVKAWYTSETTYQSAPAPADGLSWTEASWSPDTTLDRPGGRPLVFEDGSVIYYGSEVTSYRLTGLSPSSVTVDKNGVDQDMVFGFASNYSGDFWNQSNMHHIDPLLAKTHGVVLADGNDGGGNKQWASTIFRVGQNFAPRWTAGKNSSQTVAGDNAVDTISFADDILNPFSSVVTRFTAPQSGFYRSKAHVLLRGDVGSNAPYTARLKIDPVTGDSIAGGPFAETRRTYSSTGEQTIRVNASNMYLNEGDEIRILFQQDSGNDITVEGFGGRWEIEFLGAN